MRTPHRILLFSCGRGTNEVAVQFAALLDIFPDAEVELHSEPDPDSPAAMVSPAARFVFADGSDLWLTGYLDDKEAVKRALSWSFERGVPRYE